MEVPPLPLHSRSLSFACSRSVPPTCRHQDASAPAPTHPSGFPASRSVCTGSSPSAALHHGRKSSPAACGSAHPRTHTPPEARPGTHPAAAALPSKTASPAHAPSPRFPPGSARCASLSFSPAGRSGMTPFAGPSPVCPAPACASPGRKCHTNKKAGKIYFLSGF